MIYNYDRRAKTAGVIKPPPRLMKDLREALYSLICGQAWYLQEFTLKMQGLSRKDVANAHSIIQFCKKYAPKPKYYKRPARVKVPVNLAGWDYLNGDEKKQALNRLPVVTLNFYFKGGGSNPGFWRPRDALLRVMFSVAPADLDGLKYILKVADGILVHETRHIAQTLMGYAGKGENLLAPALQKNDPDAEWALLDIELQPLIGDAIKWLRNELAGTTPSERRRVVQEYVGEIPGKTWMLGSDAIKKLRKYDEKKWQYALRDIYKGVSDLL